MKVGVYLYIWSLMLVYVKCASNVIEGRMDIEWESNICGETLKLNHNEGASLTSSGKAPNGSCTILVRAVGSLPDRCRFKYLCVNVTEASMVNCDAKVTFTMKKPGKPDITRELGCESFPKNDWCTASDLLSVTVMEKPEYTNQDEQRYGFNATVTSICRSITDISKYPRDDFTPVDLLLAENEERINGIIVGVCLCSIFLVAFIVTFCYNKNRNVTRIKSES